MECNVTDKSELLQQLKIDRTKPKTEKRLINMAPAVVLVLSVYFATALVKPVAFSGSETTPGKSTCLPALGC